MKDFLSTLWGRVLAILAVFTMLMGIGAEAFSIYRSWQDSQIAGNNILKSQAEACSARVKAMIDSTPLNEMGSATERIKRDCDPDYGARGKECDGKFQAILVELRNAKPEQRDALKEKIAAHNAVCTITDDQKKQAAAIVADVIATSGEPAELVEIKLKRRQAATAEKNGRYDEAHTLYKNAEILAENYEIKTEGNPAALTADTLSSVAYTALFLREYQEALSAVDRALKLKPNDLFYMTNRAHALMFLGRDNEARELYLSNRSKKVSAHNWNYYIRQDFQALKAAGLTTPLMDEIEKQL